MNPSSGFRVPRSEFQLPTVPFAIIRAMADVAPLGTRATPIRILQEAAEVAEVFFPFLFHFHPHFHFVFFRGQINPSSGFQVPRSEFQIPTASFALIRADSRATSPSCFRVFRVFRGKQPVIRAHPSHPWSICGRFELPKVADPGISVH